MYKKQNAAKRSKTWSAVWARTVATANETGDGFSHGIRQLRLAHRIRHVADDASNLGIEFRIGARQFSREFRHAGDGTETLDELREHCGRTHANVVE